MKRALRASEASSEHQEALKRAQRIFADLEDMGFGRVMRHKDGSPGIRKFNVQTLGESQWKCLT